MHSPMLSVVLLLVIPLSVLAFAYLRWWPSRSRWIARLNLVLSASAATIVGAWCWHIADGGSAIWRPVLATTAAYLTFVCLLIGVELLSRLVLKPTPAPESQPKTSV
jgi:hypothetical protein